MTEKLSEHGPIPDVDATDVVAVLVVRGDQSDPRVPSESAKGAIRCVLGQTAAPGLLLVVHAGDDPPLKLAFGSADTLVKQVHAPRARNFGQAVDDALNSPQVADIPGLKRARWIWLIHDDMDLDPGALAVMLKTARSSADIFAVGPKQLDYGDRNRLLELGIRATGSSRRIEDIEVDEIDQGQYDDREDVLAVGTAGMLVKKSAWDKVGGLDPALGPFGDGLEYGRRLRRAGGRVVVAPQAMVYHQQSSRLGEQGGNASFADRRAAQLYNWCLSASPLLLPFLIVWLPALTAVRFVARLLMRQPNLAIAELVGYVKMVGMSGAMFRGRKRVAHAATEPRSAVSAFHENALQVARARRLKRRVANQKKLSPTVLDQDALEASRMHRLRAVLVLVAALLVSTVVAIVAWRPYLSGVEGALWGDLPTSWRTLMLQATSGWQLAGDGAAGPASPVLLALALMTAPFALLGFPPIVIAPALPLLAIPFALGFGWLLSSTFTQSTAIRLAGGVLWGFSAPLLIALVRGDLPSLMALVVLPLIVTGLLRGLGPSRQRIIQGVSQVRVVNRPDRFAWIAVAGLATLLAGSFVPVLIPVTLFLAITIAVARPGSQQALLDESGDPVDRGSYSAARKVWGILIAIVPSIVWIAPSLAARIASFDSGDFLLWATGAVRSSAPTSSWWQFLSGFQVEPLVLSAMGESVARPWAIAAVAGGLTLLAWAVIALAVTLFHPHGRGTTAALFFGGALAFWAVSIAVSSQSDGVFMTPVLMGAVALFLICVVSVAQSPLIVSSKGLRRDAQAERRAFFRISQGLIATLAATATATAVLVLGVLGPLGSVAPSGLGGMPDFAVSPSREDAFPLIAQDSQDGERRARVLELSMEGPLLESALLRGSGVQLADLLASTADRSCSNHQAVLGSESSLADASAALVTGIRSGAADDLAKHAIDLVLLQATSDNGADIANTVDATEGFERIGTVDAGTMWRVRPDQLSPSRVEVELESGETIPVDSKAVEVDTRLEVPENGTLILAETKDPGWRAEFDGVDLEPVDGDDWRQAFSIPAGNGRLHVRYELPFNSWWTFASLLSIAVLVVSAVPLRARGSLKTPVENEEQITQETAAGAARLSKDEGAGDG